MRKIIKKPEPRFWKAFKKKYPQKTYNDLGKSDEDKNLRSKIRDFMIKNQKGLCCYCCKSIDTDNSHNEHIKPQNSYPHLSMDYQNLLASCTTPTGKEPSCGHAKRDKYDEKRFVSPLDDDCKEHFKFLPDGRILPMSEKGDYTIKLLNLWSFDLTKSRRALLKDCEKSAKQLDRETFYQYYIAENNGILPRFVDMVSYFYDEGFFDFDLDGKNG